MNVMLDPVSPWRSTRRGKLDSVGPVSGPDSQYDDGAECGAVSQHRGIATMRTNEGIKLPSVPSQPPGSSQGPGAELTPVASVQSVAVSAPVFSIIVHFIPSLISDLLKDITMNM